MSKEKQLLPLVIDTALRAGKLIMEVYQSAFEVEFKDDRSPLTLADKKAHEAIAGSLSPLFPLLSEEGKAIPFDERRKWTRFWMVDPLDGTKEFLKRNHEFTVNIALIENAVPVLGVVYAPALHTIYFAEKSTGSFRCSWNKTENFSAHQIISHAEQLPLSYNERPFTVVASRSHMSPETAAFIESLKARHGMIDFVSSGSSLKLCLVAEGKADVYPRLAPTMEWDTAAGHAVVLYSGKKVTLHPSGQDMFYNKPSLINDWFVVQ